ncbi:hypothetical protein AVEN_216641-1 [Araneus ventricosus]|uniref:Uncharacterized protein n=1 Tax=Araneus ventricosus TaxID=182803 RepID=A0A4Y2DV66_ARAVE|nr:hypothetical protein AVEN_216641-1 [Araneus ventricosus]
MMENAEQIELLKRKRTTLRSSVTKLINKIEAELKKTDVTEENDIKLYIETLNDKFESLKLTDSNLEKILSLKTKSGIVIRPIRKLCPLELDGESLITNEDEVPDTPGDPETQDVPESNTVTTRAGRQARPPSRYRP